MLAELEGENRQVTQELEVASVPRTDRRADTRQLIALLDDAEDKEALRRQIKQQIRHLVEGIIVQIEGRPRTKKASGTRAWPGA